MSEHNLFNFQQKLEQLYENFDFDFIALALVQSVEDRFRLKWKYEVGNRSDRYKQISLQSSKGVVGIVFKTGKMMLIEDTKIMMGKNDLHNYPIVAAEELTSFGAIPLFKNHRVSGVLLVAYRNEKKMTQDKFERIIQMTGPKFGPFYYREVVQN